MIARPSVMAVYLLPFETCLHDGFNIQNLREGVVVGVKMRSISGVVDACSLSRTSRRCGKHLMLRMTTYQTGVYEHVVLLMTHSALPIPTVEIGSYFGVRAHTIMDDLFCASTHHTVAPSLAQLWY